MTKPFEAIDFELCCLTFQNLISIFFDSGTLVTNDLCNMQKWPSFNRIKIKEDRTLESMAIKALKCHAVFRCVLISLMRVCLSNRPSVKVFFPEYAKPRVFDSLD